tara:strand:- start:603 stop:794 length:192 start_codon:yes stop_codon:yes gene_type:complete
MNLDSRISYIGGFVTTVALSMTMVDMVTAALVGLVGGFFGLLGKEVFYFIKSKWQKRSRKFKR